MPEADRWKETSQTHLLLSLDVASSTIPSYTLVCPYGHLIAGRFLNQLSIMATRVPPSTTPLSAEEKPVLSKDLARPADYKKVLKVSTR